MEKFKMYIVYFGTLSMGKRFDDSLEIMKAIVGFLKDNPHKTVRIENYIWDKRKNDPKDK